MPYKDRVKQISYQREWVGVRRKKWILENGPCVKCGSNISLEIYHIDPSQKEGRISWSDSKKLRDRELIKCQVLCFVCHKKKTIQEVTKPLIHGTYHGYNQRGCRCRLCRMAHTDYKRNSRRNRKAK